MYDDQDIFVRGPTGGFMVKQADLVNSTLFMATLAALGQSLWYKLCTVSEKTMSAKKNFYRN
jgi:hypothetical protein